MKIKVNEWIFSLPVLMPLLTGLTLVLVITLGEF